MKNENIVRNQTRDIQTNKGHGFSQNEINNKTEQKPFLKAFQNDFLHLSHIFMSHFYMKIAYLFNQTRGPCYKYKV